MLSVSYQFAVRILDAMLRWIESTAPISTTPHKLCVHSSIMGVKSLRAQWSQRMLDVLSHGELWPLNADEIFIVTCPVLEHEPIITLVSLILVSFAEVPPKHKMFGDVVNTRTYQTHGNIMPGHASVLSLGELVGFPVLDGLKVHDTVVVEILPGENLILNTSRMDIRQGVLVVIPAAKAKVKSTNEGDFVINDDEFLVMCLRIFVN